MRRRKKFRSNLSSRPSTRFLLLRIAHRATVDSAVAPRLALSFGVAASGAKSRRGTQLNSPLFPISAGASTATQSDTQVAGRCHQRKPPAINMPDESDARAVDAESACQRRCAGSWLRLRYQVCRRTMRICQGLRSCVAKSNHAISRPFLARSRHLKTGTLAAGNSEPQETLPLVVK
jgi:hypothetical protein